MELSSLCGLPTQYRIDTLETAARQQAASKLTNSLRISLLAGNFCGEEFA